MNADILTRVVAAFADVLKVPVGPQDDFFALGGDSVGSEQVLTQISAAIGHDLPGWVLLDHPRPVDVVDFLSGLLP
jgi:Phosphopantetheine attachment site